jgi:hypothetical protein
MFKSLFLGQIFVAWQPKRKGKFWKYWAFLCKFNKKKDKKKIGIIASLPT